MQLETIDKCTVCGSGQLKEAYSCKDYFVSGEKFTIQSCDKCGFHFTSPRPTEISIGPYYESEDYVSHSKSKTGLVNRLFHIARKYTLNYKKRVVKRYSAANSILDYGCGTGEFLNSMNKSGWICQGVEPGAGARQHAISEYGLEVGEEAKLAEIPGGSLDAITLWHVLEHVYPLENRLDLFYKILKPEGSLFLGLPNINSWDAKKYKSFWAAWDVPRHIHHFNKDTIKQLVEKSGFKLVAVKPMYLDAIYISMLSEKYKHGTEKNLNGIINGFRSNMYACTHQKNYSSLIYIFKK